MQFTQLLVAAAAFAVASAQTVMFTNSNFNGIKVGSPFNITWSGATSGITLKLKTGSASAQVYVETIASGFSRPSLLKKYIKCFAGDISGTYFLWTPDSSIVDGTYNLEIDYSTEPPNYSIQFPITGGLLSSTSGPSSTSATGTSSLASVTTTSTSTASHTSSASNSSSASKTASSTVKSSKSSYADEVIKSTDNHSGSSSTASPTATTSVPTSNNAAQYASSFAFVLMSFVAVAALN
jgi:hypothetical protein